MSRLIGLAIVAGGVTLAVIIGNRMSAEAMSVVIGVVFGVAASIPTSLLIVAATRGRRSEESYYRSLGPDPQPRTQQPNIYIVNPGVQPAQPARPQLPEPYSYAMPQLERRFTVVGDEDFDER